MKRAAVTNMVCHNYRRIPAIALAKQMIERGELGDRIFHCRARYAQDWIVDPDFPLTWRFNKKICGSGAHGDINAHIIDLARYLVPLPVPQRWRRRMIALGSGDPTRLVCSTLIAQAFETVRYPILPRVTLMESPAARREILHIRHSSLYAPRDFDISPFFQVVKPTIETGFNYKQLHWSDLPSLDRDPRERPPRRIRREPRRAGSLLSIEE